MSEETAQEPGRADSSPAPAEDAQLPGGGSRYPVIVVVTAADREAANRAAQLLDPTSSGETFTAGISPLGTQPPTHYWASTTVTAEQWLMLLDMRERVFPSARVAEWYNDIEPGRPARLLAELGLKTIYVPPQFEPSEDEPIPAPGGIHTGSEE